IPSWLGRSPTSGIGQHGSDHRGLSPAQLQRGLLVVSLRGSFDPVDPFTHLDHVEVYFDNSLFGPDQLYQNGEISLKTFPQITPTRPKEHILDSLLGDRACAL